MARTVILQDGFFSQAKTLRAHFEDRFGDPRSADSGRFTWDYWHVPEQYTLLRTPAYHFFPQPLYRALHERLVRFGREQLGCHDISPPWLSCYVDGCEQKLHGDLPHGPFAFVYSLTPWRGRKFTGGETLLLRDDVLSFWQNDWTGKGMEQGEIFQAVPALFNRLTVFDPRVPHGVKRVEGVQDVRLGRLVIHGWFVQPRPFIQGKLRPAELSRMIEELGDTVLGPVLRGVGVQGVLCWSWRVGVGGRPQELRLLSDTLRSGDPRICSELRQALGKWLRTRRFPPKTRGSKVTLPLIFEAR